MKQIFLKLFKTNPLSYVNATIEPNMFTRNFIKHEHLVECPQIS